MSVFENRCKKISEGDCWHTLIILKMRTTTTAIINVHQRWIFQHEHSLGSRKHLFLVMVCCCMTWWCWFLGCTELCVSLFPCMLLCPVIHITYRIICDLPLMSTNSFICVLKTCGLSNYSILLTNYGNVALGDAFGDWLEQRFGLHLPG